MTKNIYTSVSRRFGKILFRGYKDGKRVQGKLNYSPTLYVATQLETEIKSIYGRNLESRKFESISQAGSWLKDNRDMLAIHGNNKYEYAFIHEFFRGELDVSMDEIRLMPMDIETSVEFGFPDIENPVEEVLLITCIDFATKKPIIFGCKEYTGKYAQYYHRCTDEKDLLTRFIDYVRDTDVDIITGWNVDYFDIAYLGARITRLMGEEVLARLSPFGIVDRVVDDIQGRIMIRYEIVGRSVLDYLDLYKKFRLINRESYKLDFIAEIELGRKKLENPYPTFKEHYTNGWNHPEFSFVDYNVIDTELIDALEDKLGMIYLAVVMAYIAKVNYNDVFSPVKVWENYISWSLYEQNIFIPLKEHRRADHQIVGGYVANPVPGFYRWLACADATSLYPSIIMTWNMSPETLVGMRDSTVDGLLNGSVKNDTEHAMAANGALFSKDKIGVMPQLTAKLFDGRQAYKGKMKDAKKRHELIKDELTKRGIAIPQ